MSGVIRGALAVFIEDQPVAFGSADSEIDIAADADDIVVLIGRGRALYIANDVATAVDDQPALEV